MAMTITIKNSTRQFGLQTWPYVDSDFTKYMDSSYQQAPVFLYYFESMLWQVKMSMTVSDLNVKCRDEGCFWSRENEDFLKVTGHCTISIQLPYTPHPRVVQISFLIHHIPSGKCGTLPISTGFNVKMKSQCSVGSLLESLFLYRSLMRRRDAVVQFGQPIYNRRYLTACRPHWYTYTWDVSNPAGTHYLNSP